MKRLAILALASGCGSFGPAGTDGGPTDGGACRISIATDVSNQGVAGPTTTARATAVLENVPGVPTFTWRASFQSQPITFTSEPPDNAAIDFPTPTAGTYHVTLDVATSVPCDPPLPGDINVRDPGANATDFRVRISPPATATPPAQDRSIHIFGGADYSMGSVSLDDGAVRSGTILAPGGGGVAAYIRFSSPGTSLALIETFADFSGAYSQRLLGSAYDVVVIPTGAGVAPQRFAGWLPGQALQLAAPSSITGSVKDAGGAAIAGARVQLQIDGVPTTIGTTAANGSFTLLGHPATGATVGVEVTPPAASGLPRLLASSTFNLAVPMTISYASSVSVVSVAGVHVRRGGSNQPNARVTLFGTLAGAGLVNSASANATGEVRIAATANASGDLPAGTLAPRGALSGVVDASNVLGVGAFDTTGAIPQAIDTNAPVSASSVVRDRTNAPLDQVVVDATPSGALAAAGGAVVHATTNTNGGYSLVLASGGHYTVRIHDPIGRAAPVTIADVVGTLPAASALGIALKISGFILDGTSPIGDASVQILCNACNGIDASRPIAEIATTASGGFSLAVPDPGTM